MEDDISRSAGAAGRWLSYHLMSAASPPFPPSFLPKGYLDLHTRAGRSFSVCRLTEALKKGENEMGCCMSKEFIDMQSVVEGNWDAPDTLQK